MKGYKAFEPGLICKGKQYEENSIATEEKAEPCRCGIHFCENPRVYSKLLATPVDYEEIVSNANIMKNNSKIIVVREPFLLDDELREKAIKWVEWANKADESEYNPFAKAGEQE